MKKFSKRAFYGLTISLLFIFVASISANTAFAHEVYVLNQNEIDFALQFPPPDFITAILLHLPQFLLWGTIVIILILAVFFVSISRPIERLLDPLLDRIKKFAPHIAQVTLGLALFASGYYHAIFGVELPLQATFGLFQGFMAYLLMALGIMLTFGILPRIAALVTSIIFFVLVSRFGIYMLNYLTYLGEAITILFFGGAHTWFRDSKKVSEALTRVIANSLHKYKFLVMRIFFGISLIYASMYAKFFHGELALEVVSKYHLTNYFHFDPVFLVLGAMLIEVLIGLFFLIGFEIRFTSLFFLTFLTMSLMFFGESVWPHIILIGTALAMFAHGYDKYTVSLKLNGRKRLEPVL